MSVLEFPKARRHGRASAGSMPNNAGSASLSCSAKAPLTFMNFSAGILPRERQLLTADVPTPHSPATLAGPPNVEMTSSIVSSMDSYYSRFVESSSLHVSAIATGCEQWPNLAMISEREFLLAVGRRLLYVRLGYDKSQKELGAQLGVGNTAISNFEKGTRAIDPYLAWKLKADFNIPLEWLYANDESMLLPHVAQKIAKGAAEAAQPVRPKKTSKKQPRAAKPKKAKARRTA